MDRGRAALNAHQYWLQFPVTAYFDTPGTVVAGHLLEHLVVKTADGPIPRLKVQTERGRVVIVNVSQERLRAALVRKEPAVGDHLTITYHGEADRAARGMNKAKEFTVEVRRAEGHGGESHEGAADPASTVASPPAEKAS